MRGKWELTRGQPWLVNALGYEVCFKMKENRERTRTITAKIVIEAKERIIRRRETHLDQLVDKLSEERVQRVISPMLQGENLSQSVRQDDIQYIVELNVIFQLNFESTFQPSWYVAPDGSLELDKLLTEFQQFFREYSEHWVERFDYKEAGPQLLMQAFLQRIVNSGGRIEREYGLGRMRTDLLCIWHYPGGVQKSVIELKIRYGSLKKTLEDGVEQTWEYMDRCGTEEGHLVVFDRDIDKSWEEKIFVREESFRGKVIKVCGM